MLLATLIGISSAIFTALVTEVYAHRCLAHRAFGVHPVLASVLDTYFRAVVWTDPESWAAVHRLHHRYADTPRDPHSPRQRRPVTVLVGSPYLFAMARKELPPGRPVAAPMWALRGVVIAFWLVVLGPVAGTTLILVHLVGYLGVMGMVNTVGHLYGRKPHPDFAGYDLAWLAIPLFGHGYHNSHHAHPGAARTGALDPVWPLLRLSAALGLVDLGERRLPTASRTSCCAASHASSGGRTDRRSIGVSG